METLHTIRKWLDKIVGTICILLFALMVVVGSYQIITRFIFNNPSTISEELLTYSFAWMAMFATAYVFGKRENDICRRQAGTCTEKSAGNRVGNPCHCICSHRTDLWRI